MRLDRYVTYVNTAFLQDYMTSISIPDSSSAIDDKFAASRLRTQWSHRAPPDLVWRLRPHRLTTRGFTGPYGTASPPGPQRSPGGWNEAGKPLPDRATRPIDKP